MELSLLLASKKCSPLVGRQSRADYMRNFKKMKKFKKSSRVRLYRAGNIRTKC